MPLAALIILEDDRSSSGDMAALLPITGLTLIEYQAQLARACGAGHIVVLVDQLPVELLGAFDRLRSEGVNIDVARDANDAADRIHPDEQVLLITVGVVADQSLLHKLVNQAEPTIVSVASNGATGPFERIDGLESWAGLALLNGKILRDTVAVLGEWSIGSTLMRNALQSGAQRLQVANTDAITLISSSEQARTISARLIRKAQPSETEAFSRFVTTPFAKYFLTLALNKPLPFELISIIPTILSGSALLLAFLGWLKISFLMLLLAAFGEAMADIMGSITARNVKILGFYKTVKLPILMMMLLITGLSEGAGAYGWTPFVLAMWASSAIWLCLGADHRLLRPTANIAALITGLGLFLGQPVLGLAALVGYCLAAQIYDRYLHD